jgi:hypothetical protein
LSTVIGGDRDPAAAIDSVTEIGGGSISRALVVESAEPALLRQAERRQSGRRCSPPRPTAWRTGGMSGTARTARLRTRHQRPVRLPGARVSAPATLARAHAARARRRTRWPPCTAFTGSQFGWQRDNFIGSSPQYNAAAADLAVFFARQRLLPQLELAKVPRQHGQLIASGERLAEQVPALFVDHQPQPSLLHGDLWSGNAAVDEAGTLTLFDPAVYFGDREADLAMSELFGGFPTASTPPTAKPGHWPTVSSSANCCTTSTMCSIT